jgi:hypothetical protein
VASVLASYEKGALLLDGVATLSPEAANALAGLRAESIRLDDLVEQTTLSPEVAGLLASVETYQLYFDKLTTLSPAAARALARATTSELMFQALSTISDESAKAIAETRLIQHS